VAVRRHCATLYLTTLSPLVFLLNRGVEFYYGGGNPCSDLTCQDFRSRANAWKQARYALEFFSMHSIPFWNMSNANEYVTNDNYCLADTDKSKLVVYLKEGGSALVNLSTPGKTGMSYLVNWYDPRNGGGLQLGSVKLLRADGFEPLGDAPNNQDQDWVVLLTECSDCILSSGGEKMNSGLIAGLVGAGVAVIAIALYLGIRHNSKRPPAQLPSRTAKDGNSTEHPSHTENRSFDTAESVPQPPASVVNLRQDPPESSSDPLRRSDSEPISIHAEAVEAVVQRQRAPSFKDQCRISGSECDAIQMEAEQQREIPVLPTPLPTYKDQCQHPRTGLIEGSCIPTVSAVEINDDDEPMSRSPSSRRRQKRPSAATFDEDGKKAERVGI